MKTFIKLSITDTFKNLADTIEFKNLDKAYPNQLYNVNETKWYALTYQKVCALFYFQTGIMLSAYGNSENGIEFYGYYD